MERKITYIIVRLTLAEEEAILEVARMTGLTKSGAVRYAVEATRRALRTVEATKVTA